MTSERRRPAVRRLAAIAAVLLAVGVLPPPAALAVSPDTGTGTDTAAQYTTDFPGGTVTITNRFGTADLIELSLDLAPTDANAVYTFYLPGGAGKATQLGSITVRRGSLTGKLTVSAGRLSDFQSASSVTMMEGTTPHTIAYGPAGTTTAGAFAGKVELRNCNGSAALLIVDGEAVTNGTTVTAVVNGRLYKGTARADGKDLQLNLPKGLEEGTPVWYTVAAAGCRDIGYQMLSLPEIKTSVITAEHKIYTFFQGDGTRTSSIVVTNLNPGDTVRCYDSVNRQLKSAVVPTTGFIANLTGLTLTTGDSLKITVTEKGSYESAPESITVPAETASPPLKSGSVSVVNTLAEGGGTASATITVKNLADGSNVRLYDARGRFIDSDVAAIPAPVGEEPAPTTATLVFDDVALGLTATTIFVSVETDDLAESTWLTVKVAAAK